MTTHSPYCENPFIYRRRPTHEVKVGEVGIGGSNPIRVQSMTIADTMDTAATVTEVIALAEAGCEIVRITAPSIKEAENLANIKTALRRQQVRVPLVADIHYTPNAALVAADIVEKVRINPGNYADKKKFAVREYTDAEYQAELERIAERFSPLVKKCKANGVAMRVGVNHGSLADRIMNRYGDTPAGMVESALEFIRIGEAQGYRDIVVSMKSSNPQVMIQAYRLLAARMKELGMTYPFHLGVTEAGDGEDGRIKSAVGIGALLEDGIGDTIRVSLTEDSIYEVPVAYALVQKFNDLWRKSSPESSEPRFPITAAEYLKQVDPYQYHRRESLRVNLLENAFGEKEPVRVGLVLPERGITEADLLAVTGSNGNGKLPILGQPRANGDTHRAELIEIHQKQVASGQWSVISNQLPVVIDWRARNGDARSKSELILVEMDKFAAAELDALLDEARHHDSTLEAVFSTSAIADGSAFEKLRWLVEATGDFDLRHWFIGIELRAGAAGEVGLARAFVTFLDTHGPKVPLIWRYRIPRDYPHWLTDASSQIGSLFCDGLGDAIVVYGEILLATALRFSYNLLQATRLRISKTEFISCPSCGRTLFDLQTTTARIKQKTGHLKGVKIAIMGCIVNGPGEMADADFGYVGTGPQKINLYVGKDIVERNIPEALADEKLIELIKEYGKWVEP